MTLDLSVAPGFVDSTERRQVVAYTGPTTADGGAGYVTGGDPVDPAEVRMGKVFAILGALISNGTLTYVGWYDEPNQKLLWFDMAGAEVGNGTDLGAFVGRLEFVGQ